MLAVFSLPLGLVCLGCWPLALQPSLSDIGPTDRGWRAIGLITAAGLLLNAALVVFFGRIEVAGFVALALGAISLLALFLQCGCPPWGWPRLDVKRSVVLLGALALLAVPILLAPLSAWDARSIWFFQAKIIFHGGLVREAGWNTAWSHPDYPKLLPILAAQVAYLAGFWNEQLPKAALLLLGLPLLATTLSLTQSRISLLASAVLLWWPAAQGLTNGYMDSYLALYGVLGVLQIGAWVIGADLLDLVGGMVFLAVCFCLKNEGALFDLCVFAVLAAGLVGLTVNRPQQMTRIWLGLQAHSARLSMILLVIGGCCLAWPATRSSWGLHNDLKLGPGSLIMASMRLSTPQPILLILRETLLRNGLAAAAACGAGAIFISRRFPTAWVTGSLCLGVAALYQGGLTLIYLSTPNDLAWHLATSADRTTLLPTLLCLTPIFLYVRTVSAP